MLARSRFTDDPGTYATIRAPLRGLRRAAAGLRLRGPRPASARVLSRWPRTSAARVLRGGPRSPASRLWTRRVPSLGVGRLPLGMGLLPFGSRLSALGVRLLPLGFGLWLLGLPTLAGAQSGLVGVQGTASDLFDRAADDYNVGFGFGLFGTYQLNDYWDVRGDWGARWIEGEKTVVAERAAPDLGGRPGELTGDLRVMPFTAGLVYRFEQWSKGRFWVPYASAGLGFYDFRAVYQMPEGEERHANLYKFGWHARAGVNLHRTSGLVVSLESAVHLVNTTRRWTPFYDIAVGIGTILPVQ